MRPPYTSFQDTNHPSSHLIEPVLNETLHLISIWWWSYVHNLVFFSTVMNVAPSSESSFQRGCSAHILFEILLLKQTLQKEWSRELSAYFQALSLNSSPTSLWLTFSISRCFNPKPLIIHNSLQQSIWSRHNIHTDPYGCCCCLISRLFSGSRWC